MGCGTNFYTCLSNFPYENASLNFVRHGKMLHFYKCIIQHFYVNLYLLIPLFLLMAKESIQISVQNVILYGGLSKTTLNKCAYQKMLYKDFFTMNKLGLFKLRKLLSTQFLSYNNVYFLYSIILRIKLVK
jgi:hypothetical protein